MPVGGLRISYSASYIDWVISEYQTIFFCHSTTEKCSVEDHTTSLLPNDSTLDWVGLNLPGISPLAWHWLRGCLQCSLQPSPALCSSPRQSWSSVQPLLSFWLLPRCISDLLLYPIKQQKVHRLLYFIFMTVWDRVVRSMFKKYLFKASLSTDFGKKIRLKSSYCWIWTLPWTIIFILIGLSLNQCFHCDGNTYYVLPRVHIHVCIEILISFWECKVVFPL